LIDEFAHCKVLQGVVGTPQNVSAVLFWTQNGATFNFAFGAISDGWVGFGVSSAPGNVGTRMFNTDIVLGFRDINNVATVDDVFVGKTQIYCQNGDGVCKDVQLGGADQLSGKNLTFFASNDARPGVTIMKWTRNTAAGDVFDRPIQSGLQQYLFAYNSLSGAGVVDYHVGNRDAFSVDLFSANLDCPSTPNGVCDGRGTCRKGCCECPDNSGPNCATKGGGNEQVNTEINAQNYDFTEKLDGDNLVVHWKVDVDAGTIDVALVCKCTGWVAFGPNLKNSMIDSDVIIAWVQADGTAVINDYIIKDRAAGAIIADVTLGGTNDILGSFVELKDGVLTAIFRRKLVTEDANDIPYINGPTQISWAYNPVNPGPNLEQHRGDTKKPLTINFLAGGAGGVVDPRKAAHGAIMFLVWALAIPITSFIARYLKSQLGHAWFEIHRIVNGVAILLQVAAFVLAVIFVEGLHFDNVHKIIGLIVFILGTVQPILGTIADRLFDPNRESAPIFPDKIHWVVGWLSIFAGLVNIPLGLFFNDPSEAALPLMAASAAFVGLVGVFLIIFGVQNLFTKWPHSDH